MKTLVNILGTGRCGSTMLEAMLGNGTRCHSCGEVHAWFRPWRRHHFTLACSCGSASCPVWAPLRKLKTSEFHPKAFEILDIDFLIDSSKALTWLIDQQKWLTDNIRIVNIAIYKDPSDLAYSHWKRNLPVEQTWLQYKEYYSRLLALQYPFVTINHRELVENPKIKLLKLCHLINMKYFEGKERFWEGDLHFLFGSMGVREQLRQGSSYFRTSESYPEAFIAKQKKVNKHFLKDEDLRHIMEEINRREIDKIKELPIVSEILKRKQSSLPPWYYFKRIREIIGRYFSRQYSAV